MPDIRIFKNKIGEDLRQGAAVFNKSWVEDGSYYRETWTALI